VILSHVSKSLELFLPFANASARQGVAAPLKSIAHARPVRRENSSSGFVETVRFSTQRKTGKLSYLPDRLQVRLMPPAYVKPYVKRGKTDAADAEAVCEAVTRPTMRFVPVKSPEQQAAVDAPDARSAGQAAHAVDQHDPRSTGRVWRRHPQGLEPALLMARQIVDGKAPDVPIEAAKIVGTAYRRP
jgi:hypothetical protein